MVVCFAVIVQFNSIICMKILQHMSHKFKNRFYFIGNGIFRGIIFLHFTLKVLFFILAHHHHNNGIVLLIFTPVAFVWERLSEKGGGPWRGLVELQHQSTGWNEMI